MIRRSRMIRSSTSRVSPGHRRPRNPHRLYRKDSVAIDSRIAVVIPALNEEASIGKVLADLPDGVHEVVVVDNGSTDRTADVARAAGAHVIVESRRGYGAACLTGISTLSDPDIVVFLDADYSDHPDELSRVVAAILANEADMVIGSRVLGEAEPGSLSPVARFGNALSCALIRVIWGVRYTDLGPFRAIRFDALTRLRMDDRDYGWTVQMQARAARLRMRGVEVPVSYRRRIGRSKISGTVRGVIGAGTKILYTIAKEAFDMD